MKIRRQTVLGAAFAQRPLISYVQLVNFHQPAPFFSSQTESVITIMFQETCVETGIGASDEKGKAARPSECDARALSRGRCDLRCHGLHWSVLRHSAYQCITSISSVGLGASSHTALE